jgi:hypothetical protein
MPIVWKLSVSCKIPKGRAVRLHILLAGDCWRTVSNSGIVGFGLLHFQSAVRNQLLAVCTTGFGIFDMPLSPCDGGQRLLQVSFSIPSPVCTFFHQLLAFKLIAPTIGPRLSSSRNVHSTLGHALPCVQLIRTHCRTGCQR